MRQDEINFGLDETDSSRRDNALPTGFLDQGRTLSEYFVSTRLPYTLNERIITIFNNDIANCII